MTVQELIQALEKIEDKSLEVMIVDDGGYLNLCSIAMETPAIKISEYEICEGSLTDDVKEEYPEAEEITVVALS